MVTEQLRQGLKINKFINRESFAERGCDFFIIQSFAYQREPRLSPAPGKSDAPMEQPTDWNGCL